MARLLHAEPQSIKQRSPDGVRAELGEAIRERRHELHWSQERLAREASVNAETIRQLERGITEPKQATLEKISRALESERDS